MFHMFWFENFDDNKLAANQIASPKMEPLRITAMSSPTRVRIWAAPCNMQRESM